MVGPTLSLYGEAHMLSCVCKSARARVYVRFVHVAYVYIIYYNRPTILLTQKIFVSPHAVKIIRSNFFHNSRFRCYFFDLIFFKYEINKSPKCTPFGRKCSKSRRFLGGRPPPPPHTQSDAASHPPTLTSRLSHS